MNNKLFYTLTAVAIVASVLFWISMFQDKPAPASGLQEQASHQDNPTMTMYHSEGCECCVKWAAYLENHGMEVISKKTDSLQAIKTEHGVPNRLSSCHTAIVNGYVIEGHVPVEDIRKLLAERPEAIGVSVPGMPPNSPGMDVPVSRQYQSVLFDAENMTVFNTHE